MASEKDAAGQDNDEEDDSPSEDFPEGDEEVDEKKVNSLTGILNAKIAALAVASLVIGILIGQVALPSLGVGLVSLPSADGGNGTDTVDMAALQAKVQTYIQNAVDLEQAGAGITAKVTSIESLNESFYTVNFDFLKDGQVQNSNKILLTKDGLALVGVQPMMLDEPIPQQAAQEQQQVAAPPVVGQLETFNDSGYELELQGGKPVIRLFSTTWCPHCKWIKPVFDKVAKEYADAGKIVAYHWEIDKDSAGNWDVANGGGDNTLTEAVETAVPQTEMDVYAKFNPSGSIPSFILGGRYYRTGNGFEGQGDTANPASEQSLANLAKEEAALRAVIDKLIEEAKQ